MRKIVLCSLLVLGALPSPAHAERRQAPRAARLAALGERARPERTVLAPAEPAPVPADDAFLAAGDIRAGMADHAAEIERCYFGRSAGARPGGRLELMLVIARQGRVVSLDVAAPELSAPATLAVHACLRGVIADLAFPVRRNDTTAVIPYYFQKTLAPNAGPQLSCWNASGC